MNSKTISYYARSTTSELSKTLEENIAVASLGGTQAFTCEYHGDDDVNAVAWTYNNDGALPTGYSITEVIHTKTDEF